LYVQTDQPRLRLFVNLYLIGEQPPPLGVPLGAGTVDRAELADPGGHAVFPHVARHRPELRRDIVPADVPTGGLARVRAAVRRAGRRVLVDRVHRVRQRLAEPRELAGVPVAVEEHHVPAIDGPDGRDRAPVEVHERGTRGIGRLVQYVVARHLWPAGVP
jgi:hypothetical protein